MRKYLGAIGTILLVALAVFLPERLSMWNDQKILDTPHLSQEMEGQENFTDSIRLTVPEKLLLMRSGGLSYLDISSSDTSELRMAYVNGETVIYESAEPILDIEKQLSQETAEEAKEWTARLATVRSELRALQLAGALPVLWSSRDDVELTGYGEVLAIDNETQVGFTLYYIDLGGAPYHVSLTMDGQTGKILAIAIHWTDGMAPAWGINGAAGFGTAWRDYWDMDSVSALWYSDHVKDILADMAGLAAISGDYGADTDVTFTYDGQSLRIPLSCWVMTKSGKSCSIRWNY